MRRPMSRYAGNWLAFGLFGAAWGLGADPLWGEGWGGGLGAGSGTSLYPSTPNWWLKVEIAAFNRSYSPSSSAFFSSISAITPGRSLLRKRRKPASHSRTRLVGTL